MRTTFTIGSTRAVECIEITEQLRAIVRRSGVENGICHVMVLHATAAVIVNENDDPNIGLDLLRALDTMIPEHPGWLHDRIDNNAHAHIKASILGPAETLPVEGGDLRLGTWQGVMVVELDGPRSSRRVVVTVIGES